MRTLLATGTLLALIPFFAGCGQSANRGDSNGRGDTQSHRPAASPHASVDSPAGGSKASGPATEVIDDRGFRFRVVGIGAGVTPEANEETSAAPGSLFAYADISVTNKQGDRSASLSDVLTNWYIFVPRNVQQSADSLDFCDTAMPGYCGAKVSCLHIEGTGGEPTDIGGFGEDDRTVPAGSTWRLRCFLGQNNLAMLDGAKEVKDSIRSNDIHLFRMEYRDAFHEKVAKRLEIPLAYNG